jgi:beta-glucosidase
MWGFQGYVTSDCGAISNMVDQFKFVKTPEEAIAKSLNIGTDMECGALLFPDLADNYLEKAIAKKLTTEAVVNQALGRILTVKFKLGMFDPPDRVPYSKISTDVVASAEHFELARQGAREAMVLLRNAPVEGQPLLPLDAGKIKTLAVVGPLAATCELGDYTAEGAAEPRVSPLMGLQARAAAASFTVRHIPWQSENMVATAVNAAKESDVVVAVLGLNSNVATEAVDLKSLELPRDQQEFIEKIVAANPRTIVVLVNGNPLAVNWINAHVSAILEAWFAGTQGGHAMADVLFGDFNPAGRLPMTFYAGDKQLRPFDEYDITRGRTYMYLREKPLYAFGYGLSYSSFKYENLVIPTATVGRGDVVAVSVDVTNTSQRDGDEVVQLYTHQVHAGVPVPIKQLRAFQRVHLKAGEKQTVKLTLAVKDLGIWDIPKHAFVVDAGVFDLLIGASSDDIRQKGTITVK